MASKAKRPGRISLFRGKRRAPVSITLTPAHHSKVKKNMQRIGLTRADFIALLIDKYADTVNTTYPSAYRKLRGAVEALGGALDHRKRGESRGGTWVLELGGKVLGIQSEQSERYPILDACYKLKDGIAVSRTWKDHSDTIDPTGLAQLFEKLASSPDPYPYSST